MRSSARRLSLVISALALVGCIDQDGPNHASTGGLWGSAMTDAGGPPGADSTGTAIDQLTTDATTAAPGTTSSTTGIGGSTGDDGGATQTSAADTTGDADTTGSTGSTGEEVAGPPSFMDDLWPIVFPECGCHVDDNAAGKLHLWKTVAHDNLVGRPSNQVKKMLLVDPGSPDTSYLWHKLVGTHADVDGEGKLMPPGGALEPDELDLFRAWIEQGALP